MKLISLPSAFSISTLFGFFCCSLLGVITYTWFKSQPIRRWRKLLLIDKHHAYFQTIYQDINGFVLSQDARKALDALEYTYGEIKFESFIALLSLTHPNPNTVFYDLGSGVGKAVLACSMVFSVKKSCGIEIFPILYECAQSQQKRLQSLPTYQGAAACIEFKLGDILKFNFEDATLIFINATAFFGDHWLAISHHIEQVKSKTIVITTSKALRSNLFHITQVTQSEMSWGTVKTYLQEKL